MTARRAGSMPKPSEHVDEDEARRRSAGEHHGAVPDGHRSGRLSPLEPRSTSVIDAKLAPLQDEVGGYDYTVVLKSYLRGSDKGDDDLKTGALRWIRGEFSTKTEARSVLPVRNIIDDTNVYDSIKLLATFVRIAGYGGLMVIFDEMVNLYKLQNSQTRTTNYEQILRIVNDSCKATSGTSVFFLAELQSFSWTRDGGSTATRRWRAGCRKTRSQRAALST